MVAVAEERWTGKSVQGSYYAYRTNQANWLTSSIGGQRIGLSKYRLYDAELGIFLSRDRLRFLNKYRAWSNNPVGQVDKDGLADADGGSGAQSITIKVREDAQKVKPEMKSKYGKFTFHGGSYLKEAGGEAERFYAEFEPNPECPCPVEDRYWIQRVRTQIMLGDTRPDDSGWDWDKWGSKRQKEADPRYGTVKGGKALLLSGNTFQDIPGLDPMALKNVSRVMQDYGFSNALVFFSFKTCIICWDQKEKKIKYIMGCFTWAATTAIYVDEDGKVHHRTDWSESSLTPGPQQGGTSWSVPPTNVPTAPYTGPLPPAKTPTVGGFGVGSIGSGVPPTP